MEPNKATVFHESLTELWTYEKDKSLEDALDKMIQEDFMQSLLLFIDLI